MTSGEEGRGSWGPIIVSFSLHLQKWAANVAQNCFLQFLDWDKRPK